MLPGDKNTEPRIVIANNQPDSEYPDLFWAIRGGGGSNFGVVTKLRFKLADITKYKKIHVFRIHWAKEHMTDVVKTWVKFQNENEDWGLSTFLRLSVTGDSKVDAPYNATEIDCASAAVLMVGMFYGTKQELMEILRNKFFRYVQPECEQYRHTSIQGAHSLTMGLSNVEQMLVDEQDVDTGNQKPLSPISEYALHHGSEASETPKPHKVTSMFPKDDFGDDAIETLVEFVTKSKPISKDAKTYVSLHALGGEMGNQSYCDNTAFAFRNKKFLFQPQAWWEDKHDKKACEYMAWIESVRNTMKKYTEGAFINFPDIKLCAKEYYGDNFESLKQIKEKYNPEDYFNFGCGCIGDDDRCIAKGCISAD